MSKINLKRVFVGGLVAGIVFLVLGFASYFLYLGDEWKPVMDDLGAPINETAGMYIFSIISCFIVGILAVWLYAAIRPRYGPGPKTAVCAGLAVWFIYCLIGFAWTGFMGMFPCKLVWIAIIVGLVQTVLGAFLGGWVYKEEEVKEEVKEEPVAPAEPRETE